MLTSEIFSIAQRDHLVKTRPPNLRFNHLAQFSQGVF
jgi:hypothetical protein